MTLFSRADDSNAQLSVVSDTPNTRNDSHIQCFLVVNAEAILNVKNLCILPIHFITTKL